MSKSAVKSVKTALRKLGRAFRAKDEAAFDSALDEAVEGLEEMSESNDEEPDTIEVHNHIPGQDGTGELPSMDPPGFDRRNRDARDEEEPAWFKKHCEANDKRMKDMSDAVEGLKKWAEEEGREPEHSSDRRHDDRHRDGGLENLGEYAEHDHRDEPDPNLEMDRRHDDRRHDDRRHDDRHRDRRHDDEANREILGELEFEAPPGTGDRARRAKDSALFADAFQDAVTKAEIIAPGIRLPTFDAKASPARTVREIVKLRRTALDLAYQQPVTRGVIDLALSGRALDSQRMPVAAARVLFNSVASNVAGANNRRATDQTATTGGHAPVGGSTGGPRSLADINARNRKFYNGGR